MASRPLNRLFSILTSSATAAKEFDGNVISYCLFLSPLPTFVGIIKKKDTESFKADPYLVTHMNCMLGIFYGLPIVHPKSILVIVTNGVRLILGLAFLIIYFTFVNRKQRLRVLGILAIELAALVLIMSLVLTQAHIYELRTKIVRILCIIFSTAMYASPLTIMSRKTKRVNYMSILLSIANFLNGICWTIYAVINFDLNIIIPDRLGAILGAVHLILYWWYYKTTNWDVNDESEARDSITDYKYHYSRRGPIKLSLPEVRPVKVAGETHLWGLLSETCRPTFAGIIKKKDIESFKANPYLATLMNCMLWIFYGLSIVHPNSILVITTNGVRLILEVAFLIIYFTFANQKRKLRVLGILAIELAAVVLIASLVLTEAHTYELRTKIVGILYIIFSTAMYASPLTIMSRVIKTKRVNYMPILLSIANILNGICWTIYAIILKFDLEYYNSRWIGSNSWRGATYLILVVLQNYKLVC